MRQEHKRKRWCKHEIAQVRNGAFSCEKSENLILMSLIRKQQGLAVRTKSRMKHNPEVPLP